MNHPYEDGFCDCPILGEFGVAVEEQLDPSVDCDYGGCHAEQIPNVYSSYEQMIGECFWL